MQTQVLHSLTNSPFLLVQTEDFYKQFFLYRWMQWKQSTDPIGFQLQKSHCKLHHCKDDVDSFCVFISINLLCFYFNKPKFIKSISKRSWVKVSVNFTISHYSFIKV